jgi:hypothetical protein
MGCFFNKKLLTRRTMNERFTICGLWFTKVENHKSQIVKKMGAGSFPHSHYQLSIINYQLSITSSPLSAWSRPAER